MDLFSQLRAVAVLKEFDDAAVRRLADEAYVREYTTGEFLARIGESIDTIGVVVTGIVEVRHIPGPTGKIRVSVLEGQLFGEVSLLTGEPAVADVVAQSPCRVVHVPQTALTRELGQNPLAARPLASLLAQRLSRRTANPREQADLARVLADHPAPTLVPGNDPVLVLNCGSSSIKYALFKSGKKVAGGLVERIGQANPHIRHDGPRGRLEQPVQAPDHDAGLREVFALLTDPTNGAIDRLEQLTAVGHRTVHGGTRFTESTVITEDVKAELKRISHLAPLHNPINLAGIEICEKTLPATIPQVAVFDTAFHMTMPEHAYRYAIPKGFADDNMLRRFGFHGTSHKYVSQTACRFLDVPLGSLKVITCHLGNGCSIAAVDHGRSVDTSMGLTPLEGLIMGTRAGDIDPGLVLHLLGTGMSREQIDRMLNKESGLLGLSGIASDMRELEKAADAGQPGAILAIQAFCYRVKKYIGAYAAAMGGVDALVFTGGIGENASGIRSRICQGLEFLGIKLDAQRNQSRPFEGEPAMQISARESQVKILVVPTDEEGMIAAETARALNRSGVSDILKARRDRPIPIGVSAHHVHLSQDDVETLFGGGATLTPIKPLSQPGQFACAEKVDLIGPKGTIDNVRVLGPVRPDTQIEVSRTDEYRLGVNAPIRASGDLTGSPGVTLVGPKGKVELPHGVILALRHIHMTPEDALIYGIRDKDVVRVQLEGERSTIFGDVLVRVHPEYALEMHLDTDEANAAKVLTGMSATIESIQRRAR